MSEIERIIRQYRAGIIDRGEASYRLRINGVSWDMIDCLL